MATPNTIEHSLKAIIKYWPILILILTVFDITLRFFQHDAVKSATDTVTEKMLIDWKNDRRVLRDRDSLIDINKRFKDSIKFIVLQDSLKSTMLKDVKAELIKDIDGNFSHIDRRLVKIEQKLMLKKGYIQIKENGKTVLKPTN